MNSRMLLCATERRKKITDNRNEGGTKDDDENAREDEEHHRDDHLDRQFGGLLFGSLPALHTERFRKCSECLANAGSEFVGLNQNRDQCLKVFNSGPFCEVSQRIAAAAAHVDFKVAKTQFISQVWMCDVYLIANTQ